MKVLITNDDGLAARGLWALAEALTQVAEVVVVAPDREQSGVGTSVTLHHPLRVRQGTPQIAGIETHAVEGTPADSIIIALKWLLKDQIDLVVSGINEGSNLGSDVLISGTVGAAFQAYFYGLPAMAVSVGSFDNLHFEVATSLVSLVVQRLAGKEMPRRFLFNINLPNLPISRIAGIELTQLGERSYTGAVRRSSVKAGFDGKRNYYWIVHGEPEWEEHEGTDVWALKNKKISITPLHNDLTNYEQVSTLKDFCAGLSQSLFSGSLA